MIRPHSQHRDWPFIYTRENERENDSRGRNKILCGESAEVIGNREETPITAKAAEWLTAAFIHLNFPINWWNCRLVYLHQQRKAGFVARLFFMHVAIGDRTWPAKIWPNSSV